MTAPPNAVVPTGEAAERTATPRSRLPEGVVELAGERWRWADGHRHNHGEADRVQELLWAPLRLEADWPSPTAPIPVAAGWIHAEVIDDDRAVLDRLRADRPDLDAEGLAHLCQEMRLPVAPYRPLGRPATDQPNRHPSGRSTDRTVDEIAALESAEVSGSLIIDLTTHWAGPLSTKLLAESGAEVVKVDPACRPDGFRERPALYQHLNRPKRIVDLDLRRPDDRERFDSLLGRADLLVDSFSSRVLHNLGYDDDQLYRLNPRLAHLSIRAYPAASAEASWVGYGPGVHAVSGLGLAPGADEPTPAPVAYPDVVAGLTAYGTARRLINPDRPVRRAVVSLRASIEPLRALAFDQAADGDHTGFHA
jgi:hypothetical protein